MLEILVHHKASHGSDSVHLYSLYLDLRQLKCRGLLSLVLLSLFFHHQGVDEVPKVVEVAFIWCYELVKGVGLLQVSHFCSA